MYFWLANNMKCMGRSRTSLTSSAAGRDRWIARRPHASIRRRSASIVEIDKNVRERLLEVDKARGQPKRYQTFGDGDPDFARKRVGDGIAGAQQVDRGGLHAFDCRNN